MSHLHDDGQQINNGAKYEYITDLLCSVAGIEDVLSSIRSVILESWNQQKSDFAVQFFGYNIAVF